MKVSLEDQSIRYNLMRSIYLTFTFQKVFKWEWSIVRPRCESLIGRLLQLILTIWYTPVLTCTIIRPFLTRVCLLTLVTQDFLLKDASWSVFQLLQGRNKLTAPTFERFSQKQANKVNLITNKYKDTRTFQLLLIYSIIPCLICIPFCNSIRF